MDTNKKNREYISALADDGLPPADMEVALAAVLTPEGRLAWELYHRIGDVLRANAQLANPAPDLSPGFAERMAARLAAEPLPGKRAAPAPEAPAVPVAAAGPQ